MPFTPSHTAAAIPFFRTRLVPSALMIGCMAPDFEYFMRFGAEGALGHRLTGVFVLDLPASLIALWLFHAYAKEPIYSWLPRSFRQRIQLGPTSIPFRNFGQFAWVVLSILVGIATHILWDSFTHRSFWPYQHWEFLHRMVNLPLWGPLECLRVIQHGSTLAGAMALLLWVGAWYRRTEPVHSEAAKTRPQGSRFVFVIICLLSLIMAILRGLLGDGFPYDWDGVKTFLGDAVVTGITLFWLQIVFYGFLRAREQRQWHIS